MLVEVIAYLIACAQGNIAPLGLRDASVRLSLPVGRINAFALGVWEFVTLRLVMVAFNLKVARNTTVVKIMKNLFLKKRKLR